MTGRTSTHRREAAFTLIELLVVIAIVGVLAGLLAPALRSAQDKAKSATCVNNLRQLSAAVFLYANDNDGHFVPSSWDIHTANLHRWHGVRRRTSEPFDFTEGPLYAYMNVDKVKACPMFDQYLTGFEAGCGGYGYNDSYVGSSRGDPTDGSARPARRGQIADPTNTLLFADCAFLNVAKARTMEYSFITEPVYEAWGGMPSTPTIHFRHGRKANVAWCDGHVSCEPLGYTTNDAYNEAAVGYVGTHHDNRLYDRR